MDPRNGLRVSNNSERWSEVTGTGEGRGHGGVLGRTTLPDWRAQIRFPRPVEDAAESRSDP